MPIPITKLEKLINDALPGAVVKVNDMAGDENHYSVYVEHKSFKGISRIQQHRLVYDALKEELKENLHAIALQTEAPKL